MPSSNSKIEKIQSSFQALSAVASSLNSASDELTKTVTILDEALRKLNIGLTVWVSYANHDVEPGDFDNDQIGYCKLNSKWGIALRREWGDTQRGEYGGEGPWLFNDAPRDMRLKGVDKIPELIAALSVEATETTKKVREKTQEISELASAITQITNPEKQTTKAPPAPPPYVRQQTPPTQPPPYQKAPNPTLADMRAPNSAPLEPPNQLATLIDLAGGKKGGK
jgi:prefoldin subunit 5